MSPKTTGSFLRTAAVVALTCAANPLQAAASSVSNEGLFSQNTDQPEPLENGAAVPRPGSLAHFRDRLDACWLKHDFYMRRSEQKDKRFYRLIDRLEERLHEIRTRLSRQTDKESADLHKIQQGYGTLLGLGLCSVVLFTTAYVWFTDQPL